MKNLWFVLILVLTGCCEKANPLSTQGGTSRVSYLQKIQSGVVFSEGFENDNFLSAEGWTTVQGSPVNSGNFYKQGIKSFKCTGTGSTLSIISKTIPQGVQGNLQSLTNFGAMCMVWFYDDGTTTAGTGPYFKVRTNANEYFQVGVRNSVSTTKYSCNGVADTSEDNFTASGISRTVGWHSFSIFSVSASPGQVLSIYIDGNSAVFAVPITGTYINLLSICSGTTSDTLGTFGYFDSAAVFANPFVSFYSDTSTTDRSLTMYSASRALIGGRDWTGPNQLLRYTVFNFMQSDPFLFPKGLYVEVSQNGNKTKAEYESPLLNMNPGDIYQFGECNLGRKFTSIQETPTNLENQNMSASGVREVVTYGLKNKQTFVMNQLEGVSFKKNIEDFFYYARQGGPFSVMVDNINQRWFGAINGFHSAGGTSLSVFDNLGTNATDGLSAGDYLVIQNSQNTQKQVVTVASVDTNSSLTLNENLTFDTNSGDYAYSQFFYPFQELPADNLGGFQLVNSQKVRYSWTLPSQDFNNGSV